MIRLRNPRLIRLAAWVLTGILRLWNSSLFHRWVYCDGRTTPPDPRFERCIAGIWHDSLFTLCAHKSPVEILISQHADGELVTQACHFMNVGVVRGSTSRGGAAALLEMMRSRSRRHLLITPDGPRGPRRILQQGIVAIASQTGLPIVLVAIAHDRGIRLGSWDRFSIPRPWSLSMGVVSEKIYVPPNLSRSQVGEWRSRLEARFLRIAEVAERWAATGRRPGASELTSCEESTPIRRCA